MNELALVTQLYWEIKNGGFHLGNDYENGMHVLEDDDDNEDYIRYHDIQYRVHDGEVIQENWL